MANGASVHFHGDGSFDAFTDSAVHTHPGAAKRAPPLVKMENLKPSDTMPGGTKFAVARDQCAPKTMTEVRTFWRLTAGAGAGASAGPGAAAGVGGSRGRSCSCRDQCRQRRRRRDHRHQVGLDGRVRSARSRGRPAVSSFDKPSTRFAPSYVPIQVDSRWPSTSRARREHG